VIKVKIKELGIYGMVWSSIDMDSGESIDLPALICNMLSIHNDILRVTAFEEKPVNGLIRVKLCEVGGCHFFDITGEGITASDRFNLGSLAPPQYNIETFMQFHSANDIISKINSIVMYKASPPMFWYIDEKELKQLECQPYQINGKFVK
jgi:hypothetical protein